MAESTPSGAQITSGELITRAKALRDGFRERQAETEHNRRVPDESMNELINAGLYRVLQPTSFGGLECDLTTFFHVSAGIASGCGSTGWVYATSAQHQWMIGLFPPQAQQDVWGRNPRSIAASSFNPSNSAAVPEDGGFRLKGRWPYCSGVDNCAWMILGVRVMRQSDGEPADTGFVLVPKSDLQIVDTWRVAGLAGTGSKDVTCDGITVPSHRFLSLSDSLSGNPPGAEINKGDLFRIPFFAAISICLGAAVVGMAQGALAEFLGSTRQRMIRGAALSQPSRMAEIPTIQLRVGEAAGLVDAATLLVSRDCDDITATIGAGGTLTDAQRARNKGDLGFASRLSQRAVDLLYEAGGGAELFLDNRLQRAWRDIHAGAMHISLNWDAVGALYGRVELGLEPGAAQF